MNVFTFAFLVCTFLFAGEPPDPTAAKEAAATAAATKAADAREKVKAAKEAYDAAVRASEKADKAALRADSDWRDALAKDASDRATAAKAAAERAAAKAAAADAERQEAERVAADARRKLTGETAPVKAAPAVPTPEPPRILTKKETKPSAKMPAKTKADPLKATILLTVPDGSTVFINGGSQGSGGTSRSFTTDNLTPGQTYTYAVTVLSPAGVNTTRDVTVRAGETTREDFTK